MRTWMLVGAGIAGALLLAALAGMECAAERRASSEVPAFVREVPDPLPSVPEIQDAEGLASPALTR